MHAQAASRTSSRHDPCEQILLAHLRDSYYHIFSVLLLAVDTDFDNYRDIKKEPYIFIPLMKLYIGPWVILIFSHFFVKFRVKAVFFWGVKSRNPCIKAML